MRKAVGRASVAKQLRRVRIQSARFEVKSGMLDKETVAT